MKRLVVMVLLGGFFLCTPISAQYAEAPYYDAVTVAFKKRCTEEGFESCLRFLLKDQDKYTRAEVFQRLSKSEKDKIDSYLKAQAEAAEKAAKAEAEARQRTAELRQRQAEARQQALKHHERMKALERQQRALNRLRAEIRHAQQRQKRRSYKIKPDEPGKLIAP